MYNIDKPSIIKGMISNLCAYCSTILSICTQFSLASKGKYKLRVVDILANLDIDKKYNINTVPYVIVNGKNH